MLAPSKEAAVCGGNVVTSQRITDVGEYDVSSLPPSPIGFPEIFPYFGTFLVLRAFNAVSASQGCCNNLTFGSGGKNAKTGEVEAGWGYYGESYRRGPLKRCSLARFRILQRPSREVPELAPAGTGRRECTVSDRGPTRLSSLRSLTRPWPSRSVHMTNTVSSVASPLVAIAMLILYLLAAYHRP